MGTDSYKQFREEFGSIPVKDVVFGKRFRKDLGEIEDLIASIEETGLINPISVKREGDKYLLLAGGRRLTAFIEAGWEVIDAKIYPEDLTELELRSIELDENLNRKDMDFKEEAALKEEKHKLMIQIYGEKQQDGTGWSIADTAKLFGTARTTMTEDIALAAALRENPEIAKAKNKTEAKRLMAKLKEELVKEELLRRQERRKKLTPKKLDSLIEQYHIGDFFEWIVNIPENTFSFFEIDPPYAIDLKKVKGHTALDYNEVERKDYEDFIDRTVEACTRVSKKDSWLLMWHSFEWREMILKKLRKHKWSYYDQPVIWNKGTGVTNQPSRRLASDYEPAILAYRGKPFLNKPGRGYVFNYQPVQADKKIHPTQRPISLIEEVIETFSSSGSTVLSPFAGSGITIVAGFNRGRIVYGCDLTSEYHKSFKLMVYSLKKGEPVV